MMEFLGIDYHDGSGLHNIHEDLIGKIFLTLSPRGCRFSPTPPPWNWKSREELFQDPCC